MIRAALVLVIMLAVAAHAETRRIAVVAGNNAGSGTQPSLRFAEADASKLARVLVEIGGVRSEDLWLLQGRSRSEIEDALTRARAKAATYQRAGARVVLMFYFSGHSDGLALELGKERLEFGDLRRWLASTGADVRLALVDSCKSGGLLRVKGGSAGPAFQIRLTDELATTGEVLLTSSAADELALESEDLRGSFFTHHLVSGLRGAADNSGDGLVTLAEAYRYAYEHTLRATGATIVGPQHPTFDLRLAGRGELVLTDLGHRGAARWDDLAASSSASVRAKGDLAVPAPMRLGIAGGVSRGVADELTAVPSLRADLRTGAVTGLTAALALRSGRGDQFRESSALAFGGYAFGTRRGALELWTGFEVGAGAVWQTLDMNDTRTSAVGIAAANAGAMLPVTDRLSLSLTGQVHASVLERDDSLAVEPGWAIWLGFVIDL